MKKLSKEQIKERDDLCAKLTNARDALDKAVEAFNEVLNQAWGKVEDALGAYNEIVADAKTWTEQIASDIADEISDHGEKWQEGDTGQAFQAWQELFENAEIEEIELNQPDALDLDAADVCEVLESIDTEPAL